MTRMIQLSPSNFLIGDSECQYTNQRTLFDWIYRLWDDHEAAIVMDSCITDMELVTNRPVEDLDQSVIDSNMSAELICEIFNRAQERMLCELQEKCCGKREADSQDGSGREQRYSHPL